MLVLLGCGPGEPPGDIPTREGSGDEAEGGATPSDPRAGTPAEAGPPLTPPLADVLAAHNAARAEHCAPPLQWSEALAETAADWAGQLAARGCPLAHSQSRLGENLYAATAGSRTAADAVQVWVDEREGYDFEQGGFSMQTGHFTQVVWKSTTELGCATLECDGLDLWVCNYAPAGNVRGGYQANVSPSGCD